MVAAMKPIALREALTMGAFHPEWPSVSTRFGSINPVRFFTMKHCCRLVCFWLLMVAANCGFSQAAPEHLQLFLLIGQSNMAGRGTVEPQDTVTNAQIFMLAKDGQWVPAKDPLHFDKPVAGVGLGSEFARQIVAAHPKAVVGLIPCAVGGTSLDQWKPGGKLYRDAVARTRTALKNGTLAGILWHQGEADSAHEKVATYPDRFASMIGQLRKDLNAEGVPVIVGELGRFRAASAEFNAALPGIARHVPHCAYVTAEGLSDRGDHLHFDSASQRILGRRYAEAFLQDGLKREAAAH